MAFIKRGVHPRLTARASARIVLEVKLAAKHQLKGHAGKTTVQIRGRRFEVELRRNGAAIVLELEPNTNPAKPKKKTQNPGPRIKGKL